MRLKPVKQFEIRQEPSNYLGIFKLSPDIWIILASIAQLERDLISDRVKIGLANARAKGKLIGRKKLRDSDLIRKLLKAGMTYRQIATISKTSHGSVHQEKLAMKRDEEAARLKLLENPVMPAQEPVVVFPEIPKPEAKI